MRECRPRPTYRRCMAPDAIRNRKKRWGRSMRRIRSLLPGGHMASRGPASGRCNPRQAVVVIDVATGAGRLRMRPGQWKVDRGSGVVKACHVYINPCVHSMALLTGRRECPRQVVWYAAAERCGPLEILRMA